MAKTLLRLHDLGKNLPGVVFTNDTLNLALKTPSNVPFATRSKRCLKWFSNSIVQLIQKLVNIVLTLSSENSVSYNQILCFNIVVCV